MKTLSLQLVALTFSSLLFGFSRSQCPTSTSFNSTGCVCRHLSPRNGGGFLVGCNRKSINTVVAAIRSEQASFISGIRQLYFTTPSERVLYASTFSGFTSLQRLTICCSNLVSIQPNAFSSLSELQHLDLSDNHLEWLSRTSFSGIGNSLMSLNLRGNMLRSLRSDLQTFFESLGSLILDYNTVFICDCHLEWLVRFIITNSSDPPVEMNCSTPEALPITSPSLDFNSLECRNFCSLGYHNCDPNAACSIAADETFCTCLIDFVGNGFNCTPINPCSGTVCHENATCTPNFDEQTANCTCLTGFTGNGFSCDPNTNPCSNTSICHRNATCTPNFAEQTVNCTCQTGFTGNGFSCDPVNPCNGSIAICHENATCTPNFAEQTVNCTCLTGFTGNGFSCDPNTNPCSNTNICHLNATCTPNFAEQTVNCTCQTGFTGNGFSCDPIDPCTNTTICHQDATCMPNFAEQTVNCVCQTGFVGNGRVCTPLSNPCSGTTVCHQNAICTPNFTEQTVDCTCQTGFAGDGLTCIMNDPCTDIICHANATCISDFVSCVCNAGFKGNGTSCIAVDGCNLRCPIVEGADVRCAIIGGNAQCISTGTLNLKNQLSALMEDPSSDPGLTSFTSVLASVASNVTHFQDIPLIVDLLIQSLAFSSEAAHLSNESFVNLVNAGSELLDTSKHSLWLQLNISEVPVLAVKLLTGLENLGQQLFSQTNASRAVYSSDNVAVVVLKPGCENTGNISVFSGELDGGHAANNSAISLPPSIFGNMSNCMNVGVIAVIYDGVGPLLSVEQLLPTCLPPTATLAHGKCPWYAPPPDTCSNQTVDGIVISAIAVSSGNDSIVQKLDTSALLEPVRITFQHQTTRGENPTCAFLNEQRVQLAAETWLTERCRVVEEESSSVHTVCECYHLTSFALLLSPTGTVTDNTPIQIVSKIGLCISIVCLLITIFLLFILNLETKQLHAIHRQLAIALCLAQTLFLIGVDRTLVPSHDAVCTTIAVLLHYLFLCTFCWQLVEGVHLYIFVVKVFFNEKLLWLYYPLAWGLPVVVVAVTFGIRFCNYGSQHYCWITEGNGTNWAFHGPVIAVLTVNVVILIVITYIIVRAARKKERDTCLFCTLFHASLVLVPILGVGWALGFLVVGDNTFSQVIEWLFCIFTTLQGLLIFLMHCVLNREVRKAFLIAIGRQEAANRQETVQELRKSSAAYLRRRSSAGLAKVKDFNFKNTLHFTTNKGNTNLEEDLILAENFSTARPSITLDNIPPRLPQINEGSEDFDGYSLPNSVPSTPTQSPKSTDNLQESNCYL